MTIFVTIKSRLQILQTWRWGRPPCSLVAALVEGDAAQARPWRIPGTNLARILRGSRA